MAVFPSLVGRWRASGRLTFRRLDSDVAVSRGGCSGSLTITSQDGAAFSGSLGTQGGGASSDKFCTASGAVTAELLTPDGSVIRAHYRGDGYSGSAHWPGPCEIVSGDVSWGGSAAPDRVHLYATDVVRCPINLDGGSSLLPMADFERMVTLDFTPW